MMSDCSCQKIKVYEDLDRTLEDTVKPLKDRRDEISKTLDALSDTSREKIFTAQISVLTRRIEEATALGDLTQARKFESEIATIQTELETLIETKRSEKSGLIAELEQISNEITAAGAKVVKDAFPDIKQRFVEEINNAITKTEELKDGISRFCKDHGIPLPSNFNRYFQPHPYDMFGYGLKVPNPLYSNTQSGFIRTVFR